MSFVASYMAVRGLKLSEFFALPLTEKIFYYEAVRRDIKAEQDKLIALFTALGMKKAR